MKRISLPLSLALVFTALCAAQNQQNTGDHFRQEGIASWYGTEFDGRPTASGEPFNSKELTAAHPTLPFGTTLLITNKHNNRQIAVRVNDRGPFVSARIIDLSMAAAEALDMLVTGTAPVLVEEIAAASAAAAVPAAPAAPVSPPRGAPETAGVQAGGAPAGIPAAAPGPAIPAALPRAVIRGGIPPAGTGKHYRLQVGAYKIPRYAVEAFDRLKNAGLSPAYERHEDFYRVVLAGIPSENVAFIAETLGAAGFREALIREEP